MGVKTKTAMMAVALAGAGTARSQPSASAATMIFFDWGKVAVDRQYDAALDQVAAAYRAAPSSTIAVEGHSDRSGSASANLASSRQRARSVRDALVARGLPSSALRVTASGEDQPLIATADGVREPQNRRVDVRLVSGG